MADSLTKALGEQVTYNEVSPAAYRSFGFPGAEDLCNMFQFYQEFEEQCTKTRDVNFSKELNPELQSFDMWLSHNMSRMPIS